MDIRKCTNAINAYQSIGTKQDVESKKATGEVKVSKNTDKLELSSAMTNTEGVKASIVKSANAPASAERIAALKAAVEKGTYHVPSESIASAMLSTEA
ncbi:MAG: flagellar biosynthesis anti-sigma factor FlgM [Ruminococcus sp.]|nr:flagellar biosynthesis anti-sigma factor FlgM [Ruminococcus sp.]